MNGSQRNSFFGVSFQGVMFLFPACCLIAGLFLILCSVPLFASGPRIAAKAVFVPDPSLIDTVRATCASKEDLMSCYVGLIQKAGASDEAVNFIKLMDEPGYMTKLKKVGPVDIAFAEFPFRANENHGIFLVNGKPEIVNIDDLPVALSAMMRQDPNYQALKKKYPEIDLFMGERISENSISVERLEGETRFTAAYRLTEGCRACKDVGQARFRFDFRNDGTFERKILLDVRTVNER